MTQKVSTSISMTVATAVFLLSAAAMDGLIPLEENSVMALFLWGVFFLVAAFIVTPGTYYLTRYCLSTFVTDDELPHSSD